MTFLLVYWNLSINKYYFYRITYTLGHRHESDLDESRRQLSHLAINTRHTLCVVRFNRLDQSDTSKCRVNLLWGDSEWCVLTINTWGIESWREGLDVTGRVYQYISSDCCHALPLGRKSSPFTLVKHCSYSSRQHHYGSLLDSGIAYV